MPIPPPMLFGRRLGELFGHVVAGEQLTEIPIHHLARDALTADIRSSRFMIHGFCHDAIYLRELTDRKHIEDQLQERVRAQTCMSRRGDPGTTEQALGRDAASDDGILPPAMQ